MADPLSSLEILFRVVERAFLFYFRIFDRLLGPAFGITFKREFLPSRSIDERIKKIDDARQNLEEALSALSELSYEAEKNRSELRVVLNDLSKTRAAKDAEQKQLANIQHIAQSEIDAFRKLAGVPNLTRERFIGFLAGVAASLIAAGLWELGALIAK